LRRTPGSTLFPYTTLFRSRSVERPFRKMMLPAFSLALAFSMAAAPEVEQRPEVSVPFACGRTYPVSQAHDTGSHLNNDTWAWDLDRKSTRLNSSHRTISYA